MKWQKDDVKKYIDAKEFVDTILIPLFPFQLSNDKQLTKDAFLRQALLIYANETEKELSGRVFLIPEYSYLKSEMLKDEVSRLNKWVEDIKQQPFQKIFFLTFDMNWRKVESTLEGHLIWLPGVSSGDLQAKEVVS